MDHNSPEPLKVHAHVPIDGPLVANTRAGVEAVGLDPDSPMGRFIGRLEVPEPRWEAVVTFEVGAAGAVATGIEICSTAGEEITPQVWRRVNVTKLVAEAVASVSWLHPGGAQSFADRRVPSAKGGRPPTYSEDHYQRVAQAYMAARHSTKAAVRSAPVRAVVRQFLSDFPGLDGPRDKRARAWVRAARARGYITDGAPTKGGDA